MARVEKRAEGGGRLSVSIRKDDVVPFEKALTRLEDESGDSASQVIVQLVKSAASELDLPSRESEIGQYGKIVASYEGHGVLTDGSENRAASFRVVQYAHGRIELETIVVDPVVHIGSETLFGPGPNLQFKATTNDGLTLTVQDLWYIGGSTTLPVIREGHARREKTVARWRFRCKAIDVARDTVPEPGFVIFSLVNLELDGQRLQLQLGDEKVILYPVADYHTLMPSVRALRGIDVTYQAVMRISSLDDLPQTQERVDALCRLLTLVRGTLITWISFKVVSDSDEFVISTHRESFTRNFGLMDLIPGSDKDSLVSFIETGFLKLPESKEVWDIDRIILAYIDSKAEQVVMEARGLQLAVCMEILRAKYLEGHDKTYILPGNVFKRALRKIKSAVKDVLTHDVTNITEGQMEMMVDHLTGLNYYSFRAALRDMVVEVAMYGTEDERERDINKFLLMRNDLVHKGSFPSTHEDAYEQYQFMDVFIGRFLLATLGFSASTLRPWTARFRNRS